MMNQSSLPVTYSDIELASHRLKSAAFRTPVLTSSLINEFTKAQVFFKCDNLQRAGAFKFRGAYNTIASLSDEQKSKGVVAFSSGNHAQAIALAAQLLNVSATNIMPKDAPAMKIANTRRYGATVILYDRRKEDREAIARQIAGEHGATIIPPFDHPQIIAGQGTAAKELLEDVGELDYLFVPVGGGGLLSGSAIAASQLSPKCLVYGVEPEAGNDVQQSLRTGTRIKIDVPDTIADGAQTQQVGKLPFVILQSLVKDILTVSDDQLREQMKFFAEEMKMIVEPTGCLGIAAALSSMVDLSGARVGIIVSGGNVDMNVFCQIVANQANKEAHNAIRANK